MDDRTIVFSYIQQSEARAVTNFYRSSTQLKIRFSSNPIQLFISFLRMLDWVKVLPTSFPIETLVIDQPALKQNSSWASVTFQGFNREALYLQPGD